MTTAAKWQRALADTTARIDTEKKVAYDKGVSDREAEWQRAAALIKQAQKDEVDALERDSRQALAACEERFGLLLAAKTQELQAACAATVDAAAATAKVERERAIAATRDAVVEATEARVIAEWTNRMNAAAVASDQQLRDACAEIQTTMQNEAEAQLAAAKARWSQLKTDEIATLRAALRSDHYQQLQDELGKVRRAHETQLAQLQSDQSAALASTTAQLRADADAELQTRLRACQETANQQHEAEMSLVQEESEKLIDKVEIAMQQLKKQKETTETELQRVTHALEEAEDAAFDLQEEMSSLKKKYVMRHLLLLRSGLQKMQIMEDELDTKDMEKTAADRAWQAKLEATTSDLSSQLAQSKTTIDKLHEVYTTVYETLVNYRRDELVQHRSASNVVTSELDVLHAQIDQVLHSKNESDREIEKAQADLGTLEDELSGIQLMKDGHVNQAQVARKRRLHQETEALLEAIDSKKAKARSVEVKLNELYGLQRAKEDEMKGLERHLVTILVEQQKHLLTLVSSVKSIAAV
ncbi:hypothetical protein SPRG_01262 [Saprolegnia parasitica CBS 223.65]|uniref:Uncharacterized protein n=1 Tax=Saprolegnia parasitica (strain CBS 223.65) TaxID=695850 RepID=A0A067CTY7_SAPPC|nr:hypothetical protein SPRG_01262 [Saprolegnia parasitica CBS 223.65]KDO33988.1 hypothetical protein SPRG_01262 [Saprolegnia parasitica CBS 223.65]|eukprot:XP_012194874.1 hypothetical protein SPRG_01262 [Saprolegnia parasitica CBS 223.65]